MKKTIAVCTAAFLLSLSSCIPPTATPPVETGSLSVTVAPEAPAAARTIAPALPMTVAAYDISGAGPSGAVFSVAGQTGTPLTRNDLAVGDWTITVSAKNSGGTVIATGSNTVTVASGQTASCTVTVRPPAGTGTLSIGIQWTPGLFSSPGMEATLTPNGGNAQTVTFTVDGGNNSAAYSNAALATGYYLLSMTVLDGGNMRWTMIEGVRILSGQTTGATYSLTSASVYFGTVKAPTIYPDSGTYTGSQSVIISSDVAGTSIRYTTHGGDPSPTVGTLYAGAFQIGSTTTVKAVAYKDGWFPSSVASAAITITGSVATPTFAPSPGVYYDPVSVMLSSATSGATILWKTGGSDPGEFDGNVYYDTPIAVSTDTTVRAIAKNGSTISDVSGGLYRITGHVASPVLNPATGTYHADQAVSMSVSTSGADVYYTLDGTEPSLTNGYLYTAPVSVTATTTIKAIGVLADWETSSAVTEIYTLQAADPAASVDTGTYNQAQSVTLTTMPPDASIYYSLDGTTPSAAAGTLYSAAVPIDRTRTLKAVAVRTGWPDSGVVTWTYTMKPATPVLSPAAGTHADVVGPATATCATSGAQMLYTTNGTTPSATNGSSVSGPIAVTNGMTLHVVAIKDGWSDSDAGGGLYTMKLPTPTCSPPAGSYLDASTPVAISCATSGTLIKYTTNGDTPSVSVGTQYSAPVMVPSGLTLKAVAFKSGCTASDIAGCAYSWNGTPTPSDGVTTYDDTPLLDWPDIVGATAYRVQIGTDSGFGAIIADDATLTVSQYPVGTALAPAAYFWRVQGFLSGTWTAWNAWSFTYTPPPPHVTINNSLASHGLSLYVAPIVAVGSTDTYNGMTLTAYALSEAEVTQGDYTTVRSVGNPSYNSGTNRPVEQVTWYDAVRFCNALSALCGLEPVYDESTWAADFNKDGFYLPTEAQWEYAAGGPDHYDWSLSDTFTSSSYVCCASSTATVKSKPANGFFLYDMTGNVWEWCHDGVGGSWPYTGQTDPNGPTLVSHHMMRGGSWGYCDPTYLRCDYRAYSGSSDISASMGFRVAVGGHGNW